jgi:hypothetical protein
MTSKHGRKPPAPPPHSDSGRMCRLGQAVATVIVFALATALTVLAGQAIGGLLT